MNLAQIFYCSYSASNLSITISMASSVMAAPHEWQKLVSTSCGIMHCLQYTTISLGPLESHSLLHAFSTCSRLTGRSVEIAILAASTSVGLYVQCSTIFCNDLIASSRVIIVSPFIIYILFLMIGLYHIKGDLSRVNFPSNQFPF